MTDPEVPEGGEPVAGPPPAPGGEQPVAVDPQRSAAEPAPDQPARNARRDEDVEKLEKQFRSFSCRSGWRVVARNTARLLADRLEETECANLLDPCAEDQARLIRQSLQLALAAASYQPQGLNWVKDWASGSAVETARVELNSAGQRMLMIQRPEDVQARLGSIDAALKSSLKADDPRLTPASNRLAVLGGKPANEVDNARSEIREYLQTADSADDAAQANVRSFRNLLALIGGLVALSVFATAIVHAFVPDFLDLSGPVGPKGTSRPDAVEVWQVVLAGATGGLLAALFAITRLAGSSGAYRLPAYQALIRIPAGALVGLVAAILLQGQFIDVLKPQVGLNLLAYALVFGYTPEALLRFIDKRAQTVLGQAQRKDDPALPAIAMPPQK